MNAIVIPARFASTRLPGKPLLRESGKFLIQHVVERARQAKRADLVLVATDDERIVDAVRSFGGEAVMTSADHPSGTDRIAEVLARAEYARVSAVVNVQGDEPEIEPALIDRLLDAVGRAETPMATAATPFGELREVGNPNMVKVVLNAAGHALYFSRAVIPFNRDGVSVGGDGPYLKHLGIYAYRRETLLRLAGAPMCELERLEKLEQLRALYLGIGIQVLVTGHAAHGIDTPEDYAAFLQRQSATSPG